VYIDLRLARKQRNYICSARREKREGLRTRAEGLDAWIQWIVRIKVHSRIRLSRSMCPRILQRRLTRFLSRGVKGRGRGEKGKSCFAPVTRFLYRRIERAVAENAIENRERKMASCNVRTFVTPDRKWINTVFLSSVISHTHALRL